MLLPNNDHARLTRLVGLLSQGICLCLCLLLCSCAGYKLATSTDSVIGDGSRTIKIKGVDYPTLHPWLPHVIRSAVRDEFNARYLARWVDSGSADYEMQINVLSYTSREWARSEWDTTMLYDATMTVEAIIYEGSTNKEVWRSGALVYSERTETVDERTSATDIVTQIARMLADKLRNTF